MVYFRKRKRPRRDAVSAAAGDLVSGVLDRYRVRAKVDEQEVLIGWTQLVGERIARRAWPIAIKEGTLVLCVSNSSWMHQLGFLKDDLVQKINKAIETDYIKDIRLELAGRRNADRVAVTNRVRRGAPPPDRRPLPPPASGERLAEIERETEAVEDDELRAIITAARRKLDL